MWCSPKHKFCEDPTSITTTHFTKKLIEIVGSTMMRRAVRSNSLLSLPFPATVALLANAWSTGRVCCCFCWHHQPHAPLMQNRLRTPSTLPFAHLHIAQQHGYFQLNKKRNYCMTIGNSHYRQVSHVNFGCTSDEIDVSRFICLHSTLYTLVS